MLLHKEPGPGALLWAPVLATSAVRPWVGHSPSLNLAVCNNRNGPCVSIKRDGQWIAGPQQILSPWLRRSRPLPGPGPGPPPSDS